MKNVKLFLLLPAVALLISCVNEDNLTTQVTSADPTSQVTSISSATTVDTSSASSTPTTSVDYSSCPYIGTGSQYFASAGTGDTYQTMQFFFDPSGIGAWGTTKTVNGEMVSNLYMFYFSITGEVNVSWIEKESLETGSGFFTTDYSGQVFVSEGIHFTRVK